MMMSIINLTWTILCFHHIIICHYSHVVSACTSVRLTLEELETDVIGRTIELGGTTGQGSPFPIDPVEDIQPPWTIGIHPKDNIHGIADLACEQTNQWTSVYNFVSVSLYAKDLFGNQFDEGVFCAGDGINEVGLTVSQQTARLSIYEDSVRPDDARTRNVCYLDVTSFLLGNYESVNEIRQLLERSTIRVVKASGEGPLSNYASQPASFYHWAIDGAAGDHIVVEYRNGILQLYDNEVGIFTNDPGYDWHIFNLNNYVNVNPFWASADAVAEIK